MDLNISDILDSVSHKHPTSFDPATTQTDHQLLVRAWTSERCTPTLLPYPTQLMTRLSAGIAAQITRIEDLTAKPPGSGNQNGNQNLNLTLSILQTDLSRAQFLIRSFLRQRLGKITAHSAYYADLLAASDTKSLLSPSETHFINSHSSLLSNFYASSFLGAFPQGLRKLDDRSGGVSMVEGPDVQSSLFVRCLGERWERYFDGDGEEEGGVELRMRRGEVWVVRWEDVRRGVLDGELECL